jgi:hypothetical protein
VTRVRVLGKNLTEPDVEAVKVLADEAGYLADRIEVVTSIGEPDPDGDDEVIVMLATSDTCADADLEADLKRVLNGGRRVIWIWPKSAENVELPAAAAKYSYSIISWNADKLRAVAADDDVMCFELPTGEALPKVPTKRNLCVDEKVNVK